MLFITIDSNNRVLITNQYSVKGREDKRDDPAEGGERPLVSYFGPYIWHTLRHFAFIYFKLFNVGIFFDFDIEPISVKITEGGASFMYFLVKLCAATGGVFVTIGLVHRAIRRLGVYTHIISPKLRSNAKDFWAKRTSPNRLLISIFLYSGQK